jgi:hypothetical protein
MRKSRRRADDSRLSPRQDDENGLSEPGRPTLVAATALADDEG